MLGFFNKLFKSKTPTPETQTRPENEQNNTPTAAENVPADRAAASATAAEPNTSDTQPENTAAETAEQTAEPAAEQATEHSAQLEASANESANESASVETAEPEPAAQAQPENAEPSPAAPENKTDGTTASAAAETVAQGQPENPVTQPETEANHPTNPQRSPNPNPTRCNPTQTNRPFTTGRWPPLSTSPTAGQARPSQRSPKPHQHQAKRSLKPLQANQPPPKAHPFGSLKHTKPNPKPSPAGQAV